MAGKTESSVGPENFELVTTDYDCVAAFYNKPVAELCVIMSMRVFA